MRARSDPWLQHGSFLDVVRVQLVSDSLKAKSSLLPKGSSTTTGNTVRGGILGCLETPSLPLQMQIPKNISLLALGMAAANCRSIINHGRRWSVRWIPFGGLLCSSTE